MIIRKLLCSDYDIFLAMRIEMLESSSENYTAGASDWKNAPQEQIMAYLRENEEGSDNFVLGAFLENLLVGIVGFRRETRATVRHKGSTWGLFAKPAPRAGEIEKTLLEEVIRIVRGYADFEHIRTMQNAANLEKLETFLSLGFEQYGLEKRSMRIGEMFYDQAYLQLRVN